MVDDIVISDIIDRQIIVIDAEDQPIVLVNEIEQQVIISDAAQGPAGPPGSGDKFYTHDQSSASALWMVTHNLSKYPSVTIIDSSNREVEGLITYINSNSLTITFNAAFAGTAYCN